MQSHLYQDAHMLATAAHSGQTRKVGPDGETEEYIRHCERVASMVWALTQDDAMASAAVLHDVVEDTPVTAQDVYNRFGPKVHGLVVGLTDVWTHEAHPQLNRAARKARECFRLGNQPWPTRLIKLCDCIDNARSIEAVGGGFVEVWRAELRDLLTEILR